MVLTALSPIPRIAPAVLPRLAAAQDARAAAEAGAPSAQRGAGRIRHPARAQPAWRAERAGAADGPGAAAHAGAPLASASARAAIPLAAALDALRDDYADTRLRRAVEEAAQAQRAHAANDLGTLEGLAPLQPYRVAMANPPVLQMATAALKAAGADVAAVANVGALENVTDEARHRAPANSRLRP